MRDNLVFHLGVAEQVTLGVITCLQLHVWRCHLPIRRRRRSVCRSVNQVQLRAHLNVARVAFEPGRLQEVGKLVTILVGNRVKTLHQLGRCQFADSTRGWAHENRCCWT